MFSRDTLKIILDNMSVRQSRIDQENKLELMEEKEQKHMENLTWNSRESSMVNTSDLPLVNEMLARLESKYHDQFESQGGTWDILGNGSRFNMMSALPATTEPYTYSLVKTNANENWRLYYSTGNGYPIEKEINIIPGLRAALDTIDHEMPDWTAERIFAQLFDDRDTGNFKYLLLPERQREAIKTLEKAFSTHRHSIPSWTLVDHIKNKIEAAKNQHPQDADLIWQYNVMLSLLLAPRNAMTQSYYYPNTNPPVTVYGHHLPKVMALLTVAARDIHQVLRPQYAMNNVLNEEQKGEQKQLEKQKLLDEIFDLSFLFSGMYDIAREHSDDNSVGRRNRINHIPSCPAGSFGRSVFKMCPTNSISALVHGSIADLEAAAISQSVRQANQVEFELIPEKIEEFILDVISKSDAETKKAIYKFFTAYMYGETLEPDENAAQNEKEEYQEYEKNKLIYENLLTQLSQSGPELINFLERQIKGLHLDPINNSLNQADFMQIFDLLLRDMAPLYLTQQDYITDVYPNEKLRYFIDSLRKEGAKILQKEGLSKAVEQDTEVLSLRRQVRELFYHFKAIEHFIHNEVRRWLLTLSTLKLEQKDLCYSIKNKIDSKLAFFNEEIAKEWKPRLNNLFTQLKATLEERIGSEIDDDNPSILNQVKENVQYDLLLDKQELAKAKHTATMTSQNCQKIFQNLSQVNAIFDSLSTDFELFAKQNLPASLQDYRFNMIQHTIQVLSDNLINDSSKGWNWAESKAWAREFVRVALSNDMPEKERELERLKTLMESCCHQTKQNKIIQEISQQILSAFKNPDIDIDWETRKIAIQDLTKLFAEEKADRTKLDFIYHAQVDVNDFTKSGESLFGEEAKEVYLAAALPLAFVKLEKAESPDNVEMTDEKSYQAHYDQWIKVGVNLINSVPQTERNIENPILLNKLINFVILTVCRNLELTDIRIKDKEALEALCKLYLTTPSDSGKGRGGPLFALTLQDKLTDRLQYLVIHLSCLLTTLQPLANLYKTGHIRIMDGATADSILKNPTLNNSVDIGRILRSSTSSPTDIVDSCYTKNDKGEMYCNHALVKRTKKINNFQIPLQNREGNIPQAILDKKLNLSIPSQNDVSDIIPYIIPCLIFVPVKQFQQAKQQMANAYQGLVETTLDRYKPNSLAQDQTHIFFAGSDAKRIKLAGERLARHVYKGLNNRNDSSISHDTFFMNRTFQRSDEINSNISLQSYEATPETGEEIQEKLNNLPFTKLTWGEWVVEHPNDDIYQVVCRCYISNDSPMQEDKERILSQFTPIAMAARNNLATVVPSEAKIESIIDYRIRRIPGFTYVQTIMLNLNQRQWLEFCHKLPPSVSNYVSSNNFGP